MRGTHEVPPFWIRPSCAGMRVPPPKCLAMSARFGSGLWFGSAEASPARAAGGAAGTRHASSAAKLRVQSWTYGLVRARDARLCKRAGLVNQQQLLHDCFA
jgi:hypothetical protein